MALLIAFFLGYLVVFFNKSNTQNVVLITIDSLRPDHLGCYGYPRSTSPFIDKIAQEGVIFTNATAQSTGTLGSVPSFITSTYPDRHLIEPKEHSVYLNPDNETLAGILKKNGYKIAIFNDHPDRVGRIQGLIDKADYYFESETDNAAKLTQSAAVWLKKNKNKKVFVWLYYFGPHSPYTSNSSFKEAFMKDGFIKTVSNIPIEGNSKKEFFGVIPDFVAEDNITDVNYYIAKYDAKIREIDEEIGIFLKEMKNMGIGENSLIILNADHGEGMGEHEDYFRHAISLYDEVLKVPFIIKYPLVVPFKKTINCQVGLIDLVPTVLDILNIRIKKNTQGISLMDCILRGECNTNRLIFSSMRMFYSVRSGDWKLIYFNSQNKESESDALLQAGILHYSNKYELYNLRDDPGEINNLKNKEKRVFIKLKQELDKFAVKDERAHTRNMRRIKRHYLKKKNIEPLRQERINRLKALGYVQ